MDFFLFLIVKVFNNLGEKSYLSSCLLEKPLGGFYHNLAFFCFVVVVGAICSSDVK